MTEPDPFPALAEVFALFGLDGAGGERFAVFVDELTEIRARHVVERRLMPLRDLTWGWCLLAELGAVDESMVDAGRRLHTSPRVLHRHREQIRQAMANGVRPPDNLAA